MTALDPTLTIHNLHNHRVNGRGVGCTGFVHNPATGLTVYVRTDIQCIPVFGADAYARYACDDHDFQGGRNHPCHDRDLPELVARMLDHPDRRLHERA